MSKEQKIDNTFNRVMDDINRLQKAFQPGKNLEKAIAEVGGDISWLKEINESFDKLYDMLEEGHMGAVAHLQMDEELSKKKKIKPNTPVGMVAEGVLDSDDDDGFMARSQLYFLARDAIKLHSVIDDRDDLEPWVGSKIAQASKDMDSVRRYTEYNAMKAEVEPEGQPDAELMAGAYESLEEDPEPRKMQVTNADKNANTEAWKRFKAGDPRYEYKEPVKEDPSKPKFPQGVPLAGDSIWLNRDEMQYDDNVVTVTDLKTSEEDGMIEVWVYHTAPWEIYTDSGFAKAISDMLGIEVDWSEQGMQAQGVAHLEGELGLDEAIRPVRSAASKLNQIGQGVRNKTNDETPASVGEGKYGKKKKKYEAVKEEVVKIRAVKDKEHLKLPTTGINRKFDGPDAKEHAATAKKQFEKDGYHVVYEETKFDDKPEHSELKTVAQDMFKHALAQAKKKARK
jgi:hypothetical protein